jgi:hypothetical protein
VGRRLAVISRARRSPVKSRPNIDRSTADRGRTSTAAPPIAGEHRPQHRQYQPERNGSRISARQPNGTAVRGTRCGQGAIPEIHAAELEAGTDWPDALAGGAVGGPLLFTQPAALPPSVAGEFGLGSGSIGQVLAIGGTSVASDNPANAVGTLISGPNGFDLATNPPPGCTTMAH